MRVKLLDKGNERYKRLIVSDDENVDYIAHVYGDEEEESTGERNVDVRAKAIVAALQFYNDFATIQNAKHDTYLNFEIDGACGGLMFAADTVQESLHLAAEWIRKLEREEAA